MKAKRILILGAGGRDFHNFNVLYRHREDVEIVGFTASQIPFQEGRLYPPSLAGPLYPDGIPIYDDEHLCDLVRCHKVDAAVFSYSDISHAQIMKIASRLLAVGCDFHLIGTEHAMLKVCLPVVSVCAVRTGCGKSPVTRYLCRGLLNEGRSPVVVRHPMAYGRLEQRAVQAFRHKADLDAQECTLEEREEYEPLLRLGVPLFAGIDYAAVLEMARQAGDVLIWDGGNNDTPFFRSNLEIVLVDPLRAGDELSYYPGFVNLLRAHVVVIGKSSGVPHEQLEHIHRNLRQFVPETPVVQGDLVVSVKTPEIVSGRRVLVVEDGPTVSHGGMAFGAGVVAARRFGAAEIVDPRPFAAGSLAQVYADFPHLDAILPAMGYSRAQLHDLEETIEAVPCDLVLSATPVDLRELLDISKPVVPVAYEFCECGPDALMEKVMEVLVEYEKNDAIGFTGT
jgi:predicted GTPase